VKSDTPEHPKLLDLAGRIGQLQGVPLEWARTCACGILERLWRFTAQYAPQGNIGQHSDYAIEASLGWPGESGQCIAALIDAGWVERHETLRLVIHDWPEHCANFVHTTLARKHLFFWDGTAPNFNDLNGNGERTQAKKFYESKDTPSSLHGTSKESPRRVQGESNDRGGDSTVTYTNTITNTNTKEEEDKISVPTEPHPSSEGTPATPPGDPVPYEEIQAAWNDVADRNGLPGVRNFNGKRKQALRARWKDKFFRENWRAAIEKIPDSGFLLGRSKPKDGTKPWRANIDWFSRPGSVEKVIEGHYGGKNTDGYYCAGGDLGFDEPITG